MSDVSKDLGAAIVLFDEFREEVLPKILEIKKRLDQGECLDHWDIDFLKDVFKHAQQAKPLFDRHPEYQEAYAQAVHLYKQITDEAVLNEKGLNRLS